MPQQQETESISSKTNQASSSSSDLIINKREISSSINDKLSLFNKQREIIDIIGNSKKLQNSSSKTFNNSGNLCKENSSSSNIDIYIKSKPPLPNQKSAALGDVSTKAKQRHQNNRIESPHRNININNNNNNNNNTLSATQNLTLDSKQQENNDNCKETSLSQNINQNMNTKVKNAKSNIHQDHLNEINYQNSLRSAHSPVSKINSKLIENNQPYSVIDQLIKDTNAIIINKNNAKNTKSPNNTSIKNNNTETISPIMNKSPTQISPNNTASTAITSSNNNNNIPVLVPLPMPTLPIQQNYAPYYSHQYAAQQQKSSSYVQENYTQMPLLVGLEPNMLLGTLTVAPVQNEKSQEYISSEVKNSKSKEHDVSKIVQPKIFTKQTNSKMLKIEQDNSPPRPKIKPEPKATNSTSSLKGVPLNPSINSCSVDANSIFELKPKSPLNSYNESIQLNANKNVSEKIEKFSYHQSNLQANNVNHDLIQSISNRNYIASAKIKEEIDSIILKAETKKENLKELEQSRTEKDFNNKVPYQKHVTNQFQFPKNEILAEIRTDSSNQRDPTFLAYQQQKTPLTPIRERAARLIENHNSLSVQTQIGKLNSSPRIQKDKLQPIFPNNLNNQHLITSQRAPSKEPIEKNKKMETANVEQSKEVKTNSKTEKNLNSKVNNNTNQNNKPPILDSVSYLSPEFVSEFKTSISVGSDFTYNDITVQLVDDLNSTKKLFIHCFRIVPIPERSVTLKSGQIVKVDLNFANGNKFIKKELKKEIVIPPNSDINTLESYLENGNLVIKCLLRNDSQPNYVTKNFQPRLSKLPPAPLNKALNKNFFSELQQQTSPIKSNSSQSENDNFKVNNSNNKKNQYSDSNDSDIKLKYKNTANHICDKLNQTQNSLFENSEMKHSRRNQSQSKAFLNNENYSRDKSSCDTNSNMDRKLAHSSEIHQKATYSNQNYFDSNKLMQNMSCFINNLELEPYAKYPNQRSKNEETKVLRSRNSLHNIKKRRFKSNENLLECCELDKSNVERRRGSSLANLIDKDRSRPPSVSSNYSLNHDSSSSKAVRFDRNCRKITKSCERKHEFPEQNHHRRHYHNHMQYSQDEMENDSTNYKQGKRASSNIGIGNSSKNSSSKIINESLQDGYNCITKDGLDNIFLTYFFKLPSCSPSDRTQVRIENHNILKLKIIQETQFRSKLKKENSNYHYGCNHRLSNGSSMNNLKTLTNSNSSIASLSPSIASNSCESLEDSMSTCCQDDSSKIMLREFSRQCRLPRNLFEFDEKGVTVSFVNNVWVRVEIPILDFLQPIYDFKTEVNSSNKKKQNTEKQINTSYNPEILNENSNNVINNNTNNNNNKKKSPTSFINGFQQNYSQRDSESIDSRSTIKDSKRFNSNSNYFESKFDHLNKIIKI